LLEQDFSIAADVWSVTRLAKGARIEILEKPGHTAEIRYLNEQPFGRPAEAQLVDTLRARARIILSLVTVRNDHVVGHILFSPVTIETEREALPVAALAPMAIVPTLQRQPA